MSSLSDFAENACMIKLVRQASGAYTPVSQLYVTYCSASPGDAATGANCNEMPNLYSYARAPITFGAAVSRRVTQSGTVNFAQITGALGVATHYAIVDSATWGTGNVLAYAPLLESKTFASGNTPTFASGEIYVQINPTGSCLTNYAAEGLLNWMFRNQTFTISANALGLSTAVLSDASTGASVTEPAVGSYARLTLNAPGGASPAWASVSGNQASNANIWQFALATAPWPTVVSAFVADSATAGAGNVLIYDNAIPDQPVGTGDPVLYPQGAFVCRIN